MITNMKKVGMAVATAVLLAAPAFAQTKEWKVDSRHSYGEITTEASLNESRQPVTLGAIRVAGTLRFDPKEIARSSFEFSLDPQENGDHSESSSVLRFRSNAAELTADGKLRVTGALTVSEVQLEVQYDGNEGYSGPQFTDRIVKETTREQSFLIAIPAGESRDVQKQAAINVSAQAQISSEDFPELVNAVLHTNWPALSSDKTSAAAVDASEGYAGVDRTGTVIGERSITRTASSFSEDYPGEGANLQATGNAVTVALHLRLTPQGAAPAATVGQ
jgi:hypothetical protein